MSLCLFVFRECQEPLIQSTSKRGGCVAADPRKCSVAFEPNFYKYSQVHSGATVGNAHSGGDYAAPMW